MTTRKGFGLVFVNTFRGERNNALKPAEDLIAACEAKEISLKLCKDYLWMDKIKTVQDLADGKLCNLDDYESVWLVISSHGYWEIQMGQHGGLESADIIFDNAWKGNSLRLLTEILTAKKSPGLGGKPVIAIIQACRGSSLPHVVHAATGDVKIQGKLDNFHERIALDIPDRVPLYENQVLLWAATPANMAFRRPMLEELILVLKENLPCPMHIEKLFTRVQGKVAEIFEARGGSLPGRKSTTMCYSMLVQNFCV